MKKSAPKIHHFFTVSFSPFTSSPDFLRFIEAFQYMQSPRILFPHFTFRYHQHQNFLQYNQISLQGMNFVKFTRNIFQRWSRIWPLLFGFCAISKPQRIPVKNYKKKKKKQEGNYFVKNSGWMAFFASRISTKEFWPNFFADFANFTSLDGTKFVIIISKNCQVLM